jgi:hypothetical protein
MGFHAAGKPNKLSVGTVIKVVRFPEAGMPKAMIKSRVDAEYCHRR